MEDIRGIPMNIGTLDEIIDDNHAIVTVNSREEYVVIASFVDRDLLYVGCSVLCHHKVVSAYCTVL
jgi:26S proteasome regulatory subunit T2